MIFIIILIAVAVQTKPVQNWLVNAATNKLSKEFGTTVSVKSVDFSFFNKANINGLFVADKHKDTILYAGSLSINITDWFFFKDKTELKYFGLEDAIIKINRTDSVWNYQYIINYFASTNTSTKPNNNKEFQLKKIDLKNVLLIKNDEWRGEIITAKIGKLLVVADSLNFKTNKLYFNKIEVDAPQVNVQKFKGNRPADYIFPAVDNTPVKHPLLMLVKSFNIANGQLAINHDYDLPATNFDGAHILLNALNGKFDNFKIHGDTLTAAININGKERSGLILKQLKANVKWTSNMLELSKMDLKTNKSHLT